VTIPHRLLLIPLGGSPFGFSPVFFGSGFFSLWTSSLSSSAIIIDRIVHEFREPEDLKEPLHADEMLGHHPGKRRHDKPCPLLLHQPVVDQFGKHRFHAPDHQAVDAVEICFFAIARNSIRHVLLRALLESCSGATSSISPFEKTDSDLLLGKRVLPGIGAARFGKDDDTAEVVEIRPSRPACPSG
jgi:hypothetical protein